MANEIDLYEDLENLDRLIKCSETQELKNVWIKERQKLEKEIKINYPELVWG